MTDISESGIEAALEIFRASIREYDRDFRVGLADGEWERKYGTNLHSTGLGEAWAFQRAIQAYLPFHPPASREEGLRDALKPFAELGEVVLAEAPSDAVAAWSFKSSDGQSHLISLDAFRAAILALIPTKPEAKEPEFDATDLDMIRSGDRLGPKLGARVFAALQSKKPE
jgi:hypothetical protein